MLSFKVKKVRSPFFVYGSVNESELDCPLCTIFVDDYKLILIAQSRDIRNAIKTDNPYLINLPKNNIRPNVKSSHNHTSDLNETIRPMNPYELHVRGIEHYSNR